MKRFISVILSLAILVSSFFINGAQTLAQLENAVMSSVAGISNVFTALTADSECEHDYQITSSGSATCTRKAYLIYTCTKCSATKRQYAALGHYYEAIDDEYRAVRFKCAYCTSEVVVGVEDMISEFANSINQIPTRNNNNCYADVVKDGVINAKDLDYMQNLLEYRLTNENADETTKAIYQYLCEMNGSYVLSAQQESTWMSSPDYEINYIYNASGKYPAMRGLDYMNDDFNGVNSRAKAYWDRGGLVTICWHTGKSFSGEWNDASNDVVDDWDAMLTEGTNEYNAMIAGMDKAASALLQLQNQGVTVLWRPFHEFDGAWFWWGKGGSDNFIKLWQIMYDRYTNYWHLNNLIWVLGFCHNGTSMARWNPGEDYYDIIGADTYDNTELSTLYSGVTSIAANGKPIVLHECGTNPTVEEFTAYPWGYFMTWHTTYLTDNNTTDALRTLYTDEMVITLDELPSFKQ